MGRIFVICTESRISDMSSSFVIVWYIHFHSNVFGKRNESFSLEWVLWHWIAISLRKGLHWIQNLWRAMITYILKGYKKYFFVWNIIKISDNDYTNIFKIILIRCSHGCFGCNICLIWNQIHQLWYVTLNLVIISEILRSFNLAKKNILD